MGTDSAASRCVLALWPFLAAAVPCAGQHLLPAGHSTAEHLPGQPLHICQGLTPRQSYCIWDACSLFLTKTKQNLAIICCLFTMGLKCKWVSQEIFIWAKVFNGKLRLGSSLGQQNAWANHQLTPKPTNQKPTPHHRRTRFCDRQSKFAVAEDLTASLMVRIYLKTLNMLFTSYFWVTLVSGERALYVREIGVALLFMFL